MKFFRSSNNDEKKEQINKNIEKAHRIKNKMTADFLSANKDMKKIQRKLERTTAYRIAVATGGLK